MDTKKFEKHTEQENKDLAFVVIPALIMLASAIAIFYLASEYL